MGWHPAVGRFVPWVVGSLGCLVIFHPALTGYVPGGHVAFGSPFSSPARFPSSSSFGDVELALLPFAAFAEDELRAGRVGLWNPSSGCGAPFLANEQSAMLHPLTWLASFVGWRHSLLVNAIGRWLGAYVGTWLLARTLALGAGAASLAALSFALCGSTTVWLLYPVGAVFSHLPLLLWLAIRLGRSGRRRDMAGLAIGLASALVIGHLEYQPVVWVLVLGATTGASDRRLEGVARALSAQVLAAALAGAMLLPSVEYLAQSRYVALLAKRPGDVHALEPASLLPAVVDGSLLRPGLAPMLESAGISPIRLAMCFYGPLGLCLAVIGGAGRTRDVAALVLGVLVLLPGGAPALLWAAPLLRLVGRDKLVVLIALGLALLSGRGAALLAAGGASWPRLAAGALAPVGIVGASAVLRLNPGMGARSALWGAAASLIVLVMLLGNRVGRRGSLVLVAALMLGERLLAVGRFLPWEEPARLFPAAGAVPAVVALAGGARMAGASGAVPPNLLAPYRTADARLYDAIGLGHHGAALVSEGNLDTMGDWRHVPSPMSRAAGARLLLRPRSSPTPVDLDDAGTSLTLGPGTRIVQPITMRAGFVALLRIRQIEGAGCRRVRLELRRRDPSGPLVAGVTCEPDVDGATWLQGELRPAPFIREAEPLLLVVTLEPGEARETLSTAPRSEPPFVRIDGRQVAATLVFEARDEDLPCERVEGVTWQVCRDDGALPRARLDPSTAGACRIERDDPTSLSIVTQTDGQARLILADTLYPGWIARIDGNEARLDAEGPFRACALPPGTHRVEMEYEPPSYRIGLFATTMGALSTCAVWASGRSPRGSRQRALPATSNPDGTVPPGGWIVRAGR